MTSFSLVAASDASRGIGKGGGLPWKLPGDMAYFRRLTQSTTSPERMNAVIMGRKTWASIPPRFRPLQGRINVVLTRQTDYTADPGVIIEYDFDSALQHLAKNTAVEHIFVIGGGTLYQETITHPSCVALFLTEIAGNFDCDTYFPEIPDEFDFASRSTIQSENDIDFSFAIYRKKI